MKFAVVSLFSLLCVQVALSASVQRPVSSTDLESKNESALFAYSSDSKSVAEPKLNPLACIPAVKDLGSLAWTGWGLYREKGTISKKAQEGKATCEKINGEKPDPAELEKCLKVVDEEQKKAMEALNAKLWQLVPQVFTMLLALFKCLF